MNKIRLDLSELKVESFVTSGGSAGAGGTVFGMGATECDDTCNPGAFTCQGLPGCGQSNDCGNWTLGDLSCTVGGGGDSLWCTQTCPGGEGTCVADTDNCTYGEDTCQPHCHKQEGPIGV